MAPYTALSIFQSGPQLAIQPKKVSASGPMETLSINLNTGSIQVLQSTQQYGSSVDALAVLGLCKLHAGAVLIVVTAAKQVAQLPAGPVFEVVEAKLIASDEAKANKCNKRLLKLLEAAVDPTWGGLGLYFSYSNDLTLSCQQAATLQAAAGNAQAWASQLPVQRADPRFFWNRTVAAPLLSAGAAMFVQPCIQGFVQQIPHLAFTAAQGGKTVKGDLTLIARRSTARAGTRQWRRGADPTGAVANFAETEQIVSLEDGGLASYLIVRGSIPLLWTQLPNIKYKPTTVIGPSEQSAPAHDKHFASMIEQYKSVIAVNLINHHGTEGRLEAAFRAEASRLSQDRKGQLKYVAFDFHAECKNKRYHRLSILWDQVAGDFKTQGFFKADGSGHIQGKQGGVIRVNCIDCLDRTNVVQGVFARKGFEAVLESMGLLAKGGSMPESYPEIEKQFKILWADHGDMLSTQYAGTGAMKSGFTRTGKRTFAGVLDDGWKAVARYYLNNFSDGVKQDAVDLFTGSYVCDTINAPPLKPQASALIPITISLLALGITAHNLAAVVGYYTSPVPPPVAVENAAAGAAAAEGGLLAASRSLLSTILFTAPSPMAQATIQHASGDAARAAAMGLSINPTAASIAETSAKALGGAALGGIAGSLAVYVFLPMVLGLGLLALVVKNGKHLVNKPQLCPQLAVTVQKESKPTKKA